MLYKSIHYKISVSIRLEFSCTRPVICVFDTAAGPSLISADVLDQNWLDNIYQLHIPEIGGASSTRPAVSVANTLLLRIGEAHTRVMLSVVYRLAVPVLLRVIFIDNFIKSIQMAEKKIVPYHFPPVPIQIVYEAKGEAT